MEKCTGISFVILAFAISFNSAIAYLTTTPKSFPSPTPETMAPVCHDFNIFCLAKDDVSKLMFENALIAVKSSIENPSVNATEDSKRSLLTKFKRVQEIFENLRKSLNDTPELDCPHSHVCWDLLAKVIQNAITELEETTENEGEAKITTFAKPPWKKWRKKIGKALKKLKVVISLGNQGWKVRPGL